MTSETKFNTTLTMSLKVSGLSIEAAWLRPRRCRISYCVLQSECVATQKMLLSLPKMYFAQERPCYETYRTLFAGPACWRSAMTFENNGQSRSYSDSMNTLPVLLCVCLALAWNALSSDSTCSGLTRGNSRVEVVTLCWIDQNSVSACHISVKRNISNRVVFAVGPGH